MAFVNWTHDLETGFADIDAQHLMLLEDINKFHDAHQSGNFVDSKIALNELIEVAAEHFVHEEQMMADANYHMLEPHKKVHENFVHKMQTLQARFENGDEDAAKELLEMLDGWLFRHIRLNDHGYIDAVKKAGVR